MDFLRIGENKLKITLSEEELLFYGMELATLSYSSTETRRAFWAILDDAKHATGFDAAASRVSVQIYASRTGGCEMYVIGEDAESSAAEIGSEVESGLTVCPSIPHRFEKTVGEFRTLSNLLSACLALSKNGYKGKSSAWQITDRYYLLVGGSGDHSSQKAPKSPMSASGVLWEFGSPADEITLPYLVEHGSCICAQNAVEQLGAMAV